MHRGSSFIFVQDCIPFGREHCDRVVTPELIADTLTPEDPLFTHYSNGCLCHYTFAMRRYRFPTATALFLIYLAVSATPALAQQVAGQQELAAWRSQHAADLQKPDGWLSLVGLEWLLPGDNTVGSAIDNAIHLPASGPAHVGALHLEGTAVTLIPPAGGFPQGLLIDGKPAQSQELRTGADTDKGNPRITIGFHGLKWYPPDAGFRVTARWIPYTPPKSVTLATLIGTSYNQPVPGAAEFTLGGKTYNLEPVVEDNPAVKLFFILRDATSTSTTYGACRFLYTGLPSNGLDKPGELVLDFNHLENPPCAYTPYATCPLPPPGNRLPIPLPVGEQRYHE
jgi:uncharacterized protein (DUF1684 family)